jgi:5'(3')-deoxyribonucleotidase
MIIYVDMDGVIADFEKACVEQKLDKKQMNAPDKFIDYSKIPVMEGAVEAVAQLVKEHDVYIASTPPWRQPKAWTDKRLWIQKHFPTLNKKVVLTHHKNLLKGDVLIDDSRWRGQPDFEGEWLWFGTAQRVKNWDDTLVMIEKIKNEKNKK